MFSSSFQSRHNKKPLTYFINNVFSVYFEFLLVQSRVFRQFSVYILMMLYNDFLSLKYDLFVVVVKISGSCWMDAPDLELGGAWWQFYLMTCEQKSLCEAPARMLHSR